VLAPLTIGPGRCIKALKFRLDGLANAGLKRVGLLWLLATQPIVLGRHPPSCRQLRATRLLRFSYQAVIVALHLCIVLQTHLYGKNAITAARD